MLIAVLYVGLYVSNGFMIGWFTAYDVMIGTTSPSKTTAPIIAFLLSVAGWVLAPSIVGGVAGYVVSSSITSRRSRPMGELFSEDGGGG